MTQQPNFTRVLHVFRIWAKIRFFHLLTPTKRYLRNLLFKTLLNRPTNNPNSLSFKYQRQLSCQPQPSIKRPKTITTLRLKPILILVHRHLTFLSRLSHQSAMQAIESSQIKASNLCYADYEFVLEDCLNYQEGQKASTTGLKADYSLELKNFWKKACTWKISLYTKSVQWLFFYTPLKLSKLSRSSSPRPFSQL